MAKKIVKNSGFTIAEVIIVSAIALMTLAVLFYFSFTIQGNITATSGILAISEKGRFATNIISKDIREAQLVMSSYGKYTTGDTTIILKIPSIDINGDIIVPIVRFDYIIYKLDPADPQRLLRIVYANPESSRDNATDIVTENVDGLLFSSEGEKLSSVSDKQVIKTVTTKITTKTTTLSFQRQHEIITSTSLRNR